MKIITVAGHKGGLGKTTLSILLAHAWQLKGRAVTLADLDPQKSLTEWWSERGEEDPINLVNLDHTNLELAGEALSDTCDYLIIDTPPAHSDVIRSAIEASDLTIVPCSPSPQDFRGIGETLALLEKLKKPFFIVLNRAVNRTKMKTDAIPYLAQFGKVAPNALNMRIDYAQSLMGGMTPLDMGNEAINNEVELLIQYTEKQLENLS